VSTVISVENVSKYYRLGLIGGGTLRADLERWWARRRGKPDPLLKACPERKRRIGQEDQGNRQGEHIWALRDVSFQVQQGEVLGIPSAMLRPALSIAEVTSIGRNGAGKSTLTSTALRRSSGQGSVQGSRSCRALRPPPRARSRSRGG